MMMIQETTEFRQLLDEILNFKNAKTPISEIIIENLYRLKITYDIIIIED